MQEIFVRKGIQIIILTMHKTLRSVHFGVVVVELIIVNGEE